jgi:hypothetical protein
MLQRALPLIAAIAMSGCTLVGATTGAVVGEHPGAGAVKGALIGAMFDVALIVIATSLAPHHDESAAPTNGCLFYCQSAND